MYEKYYGKIEAKKPFDGKMEPFRISENIYFVGTYQSSCHLIDTGEGLILIDTGYFSALYLVLDSIRKLGFDICDIKYILHSHWHGDHTEATEALVNLTGAKTLIGEYDVPYLKELGYFTPDIIMEDGYVLSLGNVSIECMHTPGHTKGTMSFFMKTEYMGKEYLAGMFGGAGANSLVPEHPSYYEGCRADYLASIEKLLKKKVSVFLGNHCWNNQTDEKAAILAEGKENPFIAPDEWTEFLLFCKQRCENL